MLELDPEGQEQFLKQFALSVKASGKCVGKDGIAAFDRAVRSSLRKACVRRPWAMQLHIMYHRYRLRRLERQLATAWNLSLNDLSALIEQVERLRFAVHYGRPGDAEQRCHCLELLVRYRVRPLDAPFLVWNRVIGMRNQNVNFGHWDWILGVCMMHLVLLLFVAAFEVAMSGKIPPGVKAIFTTLYILMGCGAFTFYKAVTFDLFRVGLRYFKPDGLRYTPLPR